MTATQSAPSPTAASWPPGLPHSLEYPSVPVGSILRAEQVDHGSEIEQDLGRSRVR